MGRLYTLNYDPTNCDDVARYWFISNGNIFIITGLIVHGCPQILFFDSGNVKEG